MTITVETPPATEPVTLAEVKEHLRLDTESVDAHLENMIQAARERAEQYLGRALITQTLALRRDWFPAVIDLPRPPVQSVDAIEYVDTDGTTQTLATDRYTVDLHGPRIIPAYGTTWPATRDTVNAVTVTYTAGYGVAADVPEAIKAGILLQIERMVDRPEFDYDKTLAVVAASVMWPYRRVVV